MPLLVGRTDSYIVEFINLEGLIGHLMDNKGHVNFQPFEVKIGLHLSQDAIYL